MEETPPLLGAPLAVVTLGLEEFVAALVAQHIPVLPVDWRPLPDNADDQQGEQEAPTATL